MRYRGSVPRYLNRAPTVLLRPFRPRIGNQGTSDPSDTGEQHNLRGIRRLAISERESARSPFVPGPLPESADQIDTAGVDIGRGLEPRSAITGGPDPSPPEMTSPSWMLKLTRADLQDDSRRSTVTLSPADR